MNNITYREIYTEIKADFNYPNFCRITVWQPDTEVYGVPYFFKVEHGDKNTEDWQYYFDLKDFNSNAQAIRYAIQAIDKYDINEPATAVAILG